MKGYIANIEKLTLENENYRKVLYTGKNIQLVLMTIQPGDEIGSEVHETHDQFLRIESGKGAAFIDGVKTEIADDDVVIVPAGAEHNIVNTGNAPLKLYTVYGPPEHRYNVLQATKADDKEEHFDGKTSE